MVIDFRQIIKKRMSDVGLKNAQQLTDAVNNFWLTGELKRTGGKLPKNIHRLVRQTIANYLADKSDLTSGNLELILEYLGLEPDFRFTKTPINF